MNRQSLRNFLLFITAFFPSVVSFSSISPSPQYSDAISRIDQCSTTAQPSDDLYDSVRYIDKNAYKIYSSEESKKELYERAYGSWKLVLATGGGKFTTFKKVPIFAFAMVDEKYFGNGVGLNDKNIILSLLGPHKFNARRQMGIFIDDMFLGGGKVTDNVPNFIKNGMGLGQRPEKPPAFTFIVASDKSLVARGGSGGIAIWTRLDSDIRPVAYKNSFILDSST